MVAVHVAMPQAQYTARGKSAVTIDHETGKLTEKAAKPGLSKERPKSEMGQHG